MAQQASASRATGTARSRRLWYPGWALMTVAAIGIAVFAALPYFSGNPQMSRIPLNPAVDLHLLYIAAHGIPGALALLVGPFQFLAQFQFRYPIVHRNLGRVYLISVAISAVLAFVAANVNATGLVARVGFLMLATLWTYTGIQAYVAIRRRQIQLHRIWMIRNYALTLSAVFLRIFIAVGAAAIPSNPSLTFEQVYDISIWAAWTVPFVIAELFVVQRTLRPLAGRADRASQRAAAAKGPST